MTVPEIVVYEKAFHGRSIATMSATATQNPAASAPWWKGFIRVPLNDIDAIKATEGNPNVVAVFFETIQGEGGINPARVEYLRDLRTLCDERGWLHDDRRGAVRHGPHWQVVCPPVGRHRARRDAAGQGPGLGACRSGAVVAPKAADVLQPGNHGTTFGGNPLAMRAGVETIRIMEEDGLLENATVGAHLRPAWSAAGQPARREGDPRPGLMLGVS